MKDDWVSAALSDDGVVVDLLFRLKKHHPQLCAPPAKTTDLYLKLQRLNGWGHRQPRSKPSSSSSVSVKNKAFTTTTTTTTRCSPTTPLSWCGGAGSPSDGGQSSDLSSAFRSKGTFTNETSNISSSSSKRSKKKRQQTFTELEEEENLLLEERVHLKRELASIHVTLNEQRARSEDFKRIKFDLNQQSSNDMAAESVTNPYNLLETSRTNCADSVLSRHTTDDELVSSDSRWVESVTENRNRGFDLPDLNAMPSEEDIGMEDNGTLRN